MSHMLGYRVTSLKNGSLALLGAYATEKSLMSISQTVLSHDHTSAYSYSTYTATGKSRHALGPVPKGQSQGHLVILS